MLKYIMLSATYQQSAESSPRLLEADPENQLYARAPRRRMTAEMIRDHALASSGLLNPTIGGPGVKPYQPEGLWKALTAGGGYVEYVRDEAPDIYRRSLYTYWKRTVPPPAMTIFDAASRDLCTVVRQQTSTPLQALVMMNDPQIVESARALSCQAILNTSGLDDRIRFMFRKITSRPPSLKEVEELKDLFELEQLAFEKAPSEAESFLRIGLYPQPDILPKPEMAAYAVLAHTILNLDEAIVLN